MSKDYYREPVRLNQPSRILPSHLTTEQPKETQKQETKVNIVITKQLTDVWKFEHSWSNTLFSCCEDWKQCAFAFCCLCCFECQLFRHVGENPCTCILPGARFALRSKIRTAFRIEGDLCSDCCASSCCPCCTTIQLQRELDHQGF